jgi:hypothetical protein
MSNKQQTAVEWLLNAIETKNGEEFSSYYSEFIQQAKEMEKNQIIDDWRDGFRNGRKSMQKLDFLNAIQYYNETYGGN